MKRVSLRFAVLMAAMMMTMMMSAKTQDWGGRVIDEKGEPMPYVNVVLLSLPDSAFVQGAMTDEQGMFKIVTDINQGLFKVTSVGYQTLYINAGEGLTIQMKEDAKLLSEVVVKGQLPKTHVKGDAMRTTVAGTILEKAGTINDALSKIPSLEAERDGGVKVLGRGDAEVYINGRRVQDMKELSRLRSDQIQHVDVVQNPGARYAASVKAVVRITLKKAQGEGLSFQNSTQFMYQYGGSLNDNFTANYRTGGLDVTGSFWVGTYNHYKGLQVNDMLYYVGPNQVTGSLHPGDQTSLARMVATVAVELYGERKPHFRCLLQIRPHAQQRDEGRLPDRYVREWHPDRALRELHLAGPECQEAHLQRLLQW